MKKRKKEAPAWLRWLRKWQAPLLLALVLAGGLIVAPLLQRQPETVVCGMAVSAPAGYERTFSDGRYIAWEYRKNGRNPGVLVLDAEIRGDAGQRFATADAVLADCYWLQEGEIYVNPHGVRMARGFSPEISGYPMRRYYVESDGAVFLLCMIEDSRYYDVTACEKAILQAADSVHPAQ